MNSFQLEELIKNIQAMIKCPNCGKSYRKEDIHFLGQLSQAVLVQLNCFFCKMPVMATIVAQVKTSNTKGFKSVDFREELPKMFKGLKGKRSGPEAHQPLAESGKIEKPITSDELIDFHNFLEDFNGDFESLFGKHH